MKTPLTKEDGLMRRARKFAEKSGWCNLDDYPYPDNVVGDLVRFAKRERAAALREREKDLAPVVAALMSIKFDRKADRHYVCRKSQSCPVTFALGLLLTRKRK